ncbi:SDR family oxidoreductase [Aquariibacter albus]|uniref:SDR family oxidoreductase n=1 Tax=Aquariibacter albus TaxID=2759899 RepID=A0A839HIX9_9BURK|nr:SDR family oxidoreductase [Aquariibacter albus]MBB1162305.1 SDR family oxidoreductase [Aquariibacter albus]
MHPFAATLHTQQLAAERPVALITGGARRLGRSIALALARAGHDIALHHRGPDPAAAEEALAELRALGVRAEAFIAELHDEAATVALLPRVIDRLGRIDVVVHNASRFRHDTVATFGYAELEGHARVNTGAAIVLARGLHAHLRQRAERLRSTEPAAPPPRGCMVHLLDQKLWNPNPDHLSYTLSKAALEAATTVLAQALAPELRVVGVAPGVTLPSGPMTLGEFEQAHRMTPLGRSSAAEDIAEAVVYLVRARAVTGTTLLVDGGQHLSAQPRDVIFLVRGEADPHPPATPMGDEVDA